MSDEIKKTVPVLSGHAVEEIFLRWSEWTSELGEAISRKNIDGFVGEIRAVLEARAGEAPTFEARHVSLKQRGQNCILTLELNGVEGAPRYLVMPINPAVVRTRPPIGDAAGKDDAVPMTAAQLCDAIRETLLHYRLSNFQTDDGCGYPLVDRLTPPGSRDIGPGKEEIDLIADEIFNEVLTKHRPVAAGKDSVDAAVCKLCRSTGPDVPCAYPTEINRQQAKRIAELLEVAHEYDRCIRHMDAGGDFYEFQAQVVATNQRGGD